MCGFSGVLVEPGQALPGEDSFRLSLERLSRRGPDAEGTWRDNRCWLGHRRLRIIDLSEASAQPFHSADGRYHLVFNGEIYNYKEIREELRSFGSEFRSSGDTEVLLQALIYWGKKALNKLNGFFAFAFYDGRENTLLLARDRFGIKPLHYSFKQGKFCFGSELRSLLPFLDEPELNLDALPFYFQLGYIPAPLSILNGVRKLQPGMLLEYRDGKLYEESYYIALANYKSEDLRTLLEDSVKLQLISDRPIGVFLSGGMDSSIISAIAARLHGGLQSFSLGFPAIGYLDESRDAQRVANHIGSTHHSLSVSTVEMANVLPEFLDSLDEPFGDSSALAYWILCREVSQDVKVALSGDGADELFGGYRKHRAWLLLQNPLLKFALGLVPTAGGNREGLFGDVLRKLSRLRLMSRFPSKELLWQLATFADEDAVLTAIGTNRERYLEERAVWVGSMGSSGTKREILDFDRKLVLPNDMLVKADICSMAHGLEVRIPFLDHRVVERSLALSNTELFSGRRGKLALRHHFSDLLPEQVFRKAKRGFEIPLGSLMNSSISLEHVREVMADTTTFFHAQPWNIQKIPEIARNGTERAFLNWSVLVLMHWTRRWLLNGSR
jgi:asparagine synthase (glutamine-hydrolysing)